MNHSFDQFRTIHLTQSCLKYGIRIKNYRQKYQIFVLRKFTFKIALPGTNTAFTNLLSSSDTGQVKQRQVFIFIKISKLIDYRKDGDSNLFTIKKADQAPDFTFYQYFIQISCHIICLS